MPTRVKSSAERGEPRAEPAHARIERYLRKLIADGEGVRAPLPSEQELANRFGVSRMTARVAFQRLAGTGVIVRYPARGSFVAPHVVEDLTDWGQHSFLGRWAEQGLGVELRVLAYELRRATAELAEAFALPLRSHLTYLERLRIVEGIPVTLDRMYMSASVHELVDVAEFERASVVALLPKRGIVLGHGDTEIVARPADSSEAAPLGIHAGDIVLARRTQDRGAADELLISEVSVYPAARVSYRVRTTFSPMSDGGPAPSSATEH